MAGSRCRVSYSDSDGVVHGVDEDAESLFEAVARAAAQFRDDEVHESGRSWTTLRSSIGVRHNDERPHVYEEDVATMPFFTFGFPPYQEDFTEDDIRALDVGRRQLRTEWQKSIYGPEKPGDKWRIILPFANTYKNAFLTMCDGISAHPYHQGRRAFDHFPQRH